MWSQQYTIAWVIIATTAFGFLFYSLTVMAALVSPACPFQTPISTILRMMRIDNKSVTPSGQICFLYVQKSITWVHDVLHRLIGTLRNSWTEFYKGDFLDYYCTGHQVLIVSTDLARAVRSFAWRCLQPLLSALHRSHRTLPTSFGSPHPGKCRGH
ncbi:hypothetical protein P692DRAFT_2092459 [Suillus brevipes Sb2]|nr:hypothetical protein P692DRAFT_2092459 [Suillus brevipes Sb2]